MKQTVYNLLTECIRGKAPDGYVFMRSNGKQIRNFRKLWSDACQHAGCPALLFHDLRRTAARNLRRAGVAEGVIQRIGGWQTRSVFERYNIVTQNDIADAMLKLQAAEQEQAKASAENEQRENERDQNQTHASVEGQGRSKAAIN